MRARDSYGLAVLSGFLLLLSFPPFDAEYLAWVALVPVLIAIHHERQFSRVKWLGATATAVVFIPQWFEPLRVSAEYWLPAWPAHLLAFLGGCLVALAWGEVLALWKPGCLPPSRLRFLPAGLWIIALPILWTAVEFLALSIPLVMKLGGALGYTSLSGTQWRNVPIVHVASVAGMYGATFLILLVNCAVACAITHFREHKRLHLPAMAAMVLLAGVFAWGGLSVPPADSDGISTAVVQAPEAYEEDPDRYADLVTTSLKYEPRLLVGAAPMDRFADISAEHHVYLLHELELLSPDGERQHRDIAYHPFINIADGFSPWEPQQVFSPPVYPFETEFGKVGSLLSMEGAFPTPTRRLVENGAQLVTTAWMSRGFAWAGLSGGNAVYRAAEFGVPAVAYGLPQGSLIIDRYGRIMQDAAPEEEIVAARIALGGGRTFYARHGDVFGYVIVLLALASVVFNSYLRKKSPFEYCERCGARVPKGTEACQQCGAIQIRPPLWKRVLLHEYYEHFRRYRKPGK